jgi:hypothetical protein
MFVGNVFGALMGISAIVAASSVACCGCNLQAKKPIAWFSLVTSIVVTVIPAISSGAATGGILDDCCGGDFDGCCGGVNSSGESGEDLEDEVHQAGVFFSYVFGGGWLPLILGIVGISLASAIFCGCCKAGDAATVQPGQVIQAPVMVQGQVYAQQPIQVVAQPVHAQASVVHAQASVVQAHPFQAQGFVKTA